MWIVRLALRRSSGAAHHVEPTLPEQQIFDYALSFICVKLITVQGLSTPSVSRVRV